MLALVFEILYLYVYGSLVGFLRWLLLSCRLSCRVLGFFACVLTCIVGLVGAGAKLADVVLLSLLLSCRLSLSVFLFV